MSAPSPPPPPTAPRWRLRLLGGFELSDGHQTHLRLPSRAVTLLLARLALGAAREHPREELVDLLWPEVALDVGRNRLRQALSVLRSVLEPDAAGAPVLQADRHALRLLPGVLGCDVDDFKAALRRGDPAAAQALYRGELLPGHFDEWLLEERRHLARLAAPAPPSPAPEPPRPRLPRYLTRSLGAEAAAAALAAAVRQHRLVLLRGPGGAGKTRLAVEVAHALAAEAGFDLVVFVSLSACETREAMIDAVMIALRQEGAAGARGEPSDLSARLEAALAGRHVLLLLDNFEQLVEAARADLAEWLSRLPRLHLLVTSRRTLGLDGEVEQQLAALPLPLGDETLAEQSRNPAVALFVDRARAARSDFVLGERNHALVAAIVAELQGLPLAIELAAARLRSLSLVDMLAMLQGAARDEPGRALGLLAREGARSAEDARHASMLRVVAWSWQALGEPERELLASLAAFDGGVTLAMAAAVQGSDMLSAALRLDTLIGASVVQAHDGRDGHSRYRDFEPVREYALMQMGAEGRQALRQRHLQCMAAWAAALGPAPALDRFRDELPNLLSALSTAVDTGQPERAVQMALDSAAALDDLLLPPAALERLRQAAENQQGALAAPIQALLAQQSFEAGQPVAALRHAENAIARLAGDGPERASVLRQATRVLLRARGDASDIAPMLDDALRSARHHRQPDVEAGVLTLQATLVLLRDRDTAASLSLRREALSLWQRHGPPARVAEGLVNLALAQGFGAQLGEKLALLQQARESAAERGQVRLLAFVHSVTGYVLADLRRWDASTASYVDCLQVAWDCAAWREWFYGLWNLPRTLAHRRQPEAAAWLMGFAEAFYAQRFGPLGWSDQRERRRTRRLLQVQLGAARLAQLWAEGSALAPAQAMRLAMSAAATAQPPALA